MYIYIYYIYIYVLYIIYTIYTIYYIYYIYIYILFGISSFSPTFSVSFVTISDFFCGEVLQTFEILSAAILIFAIQITSCFYCLFELLFLN